MTGRTSRSRSRPDGGCVGGRRPGFGGLAILACVTLAAALLAGCGDPAAPAADASSPAPEQSAAPRPSASPVSLPDAGSMPLRGTLPEAVAAYWRYVDVDDFAAAAAATLPGSPSVLTAGEDFISHVRVASIDETRTHKGTTRVMVTVDIEPKGVSPFSAGEQTLFMWLEEAPAGGWLVREWGTGP